MGMPFFFDALITLCLACQACPSDHTFLHMPLRPCLSDGMGWLSSNSDQTHPWSNPPGQILWPKPPGQTLLVKPVWSNPRGAISWSNTPSQTLQIKPYLSNLSGQTLLDQSPGRTLLIKPSWPSTRLDGSNFSQSFLAILSGDHSGEPFWSSFLAILSG